MTLSPHKRASAASKQRPARAQRGRLTLSHPDFTVGPGISPSPGELSFLLPNHPNHGEKQRAEEAGFPSRALPPIGNWEDVCSAVPHPAPKVISTSCHPLYTMNSRGPSSRTGLKSLRDHQLFRAVAALYMRRKD